MEKVGSPAQWIYYNGCAMDVVAILFVDLK
jgi:hypothetical protein